MRETVRDGVDERLEDGFLVVADNEDFLDLRDVGDCAEAMLDDGVAGDREEGLIKALAATEWSCTEFGLLTLGNSIDKGLNLVPREGPPTYNCKKLCCCCTLTSKYQNHSFGRGSGPSLGPRRERRR